MPTYNLRCTDRDKCGHSWQDFMSISEKEKAVCPKCGAKAETDYGAGAGSSSVLIKGAGFYAEKVIR